MKKLAVETPRGKHFLKIQQDTLKRLCDSYNMKNLEMKHKDARIDGVLGTQDNKAVCVYEFKSRSKDIGYYKKNGLFISQYKIKMGTKYSALFGVPLVFYFYLYEQDEMYSIIMSDDRGKIIVDLPKPVYKTTQYNCNREDVKQDLVVYLPVDKFKLLKL